MAIALVASAIGSANTDPVTAAINTTGATLLVVAVSWLGTEPTISDSKGNTWTKRTTRTSGDQKISIWDSVPTSVGSSHTFTATGTTIYASIYAQAFSGTHATAPYSAESAGSGGTGSSAQPGSLTPSVDGALLVTAVGLYDNTSAWSINESFNITDANSAASFNPRGGGLAYLVLPTAAAKNPQWSWSGSSIYAATMVVYLPAAGASTYTATAALATAPATTAASGTTTPPTFTASSAKTTGAATASASGTTTPPTFSATAGLSAGAATASASATAAPPTFSATAAVSAVPATAAASGTTTRPTFTGSAAVTAGAAYAAATGTTTSSAVAPSGGLRAREGYALRAREGYALTVREGYSLRAREG